MKLSRESEYALDALRFLASQEPDAVLQTADIAEGADLPKSFLSKILRKLSLHGILRSHRGKQRGYALAQPPEQISVKAILKAIEGPELFQRCIFWGEPCSDASPCALHELWAAVRPRVEARMSEVTLAHVAAGSDDVRQALEEMP